MSRSSVADIDRAWRRVLKELSPGQEPSDDYPDLKLFQCLLPEGEKTRKSELNSLMDAVGASYDLPMDKGPKFCPGDEKYGRLFGTCIKCFTQALLELRGGTDITSPPLAPEACIAQVNESLEATIVQLIRCNQMHQAGEGWDFQLLQPLESGVEKLADKLMLAACTHILGPREVEGKTDKISKLSNYFQKNCKKPVTQLFCYLFKAVRLHNKLTPNKGNHLVFSCCSLLFAVKWFLHLMEPEDQVQFSWGHAGNDQEAYDAQLRHLCAIATATDDNYPSLEQVTVPQKGDFASEASCLWQQTSFGSEKGTLTSEFKTWCKLMFPPKQNTLENTLEDEQMMKSLNKLFGGLLDLDADWNPADAACKQLLKESIRLLQLALWEKFGGAERMAGKDITPPEGGIDQAVHELVLALMLFEDAKHKWGPVMVLVGVDARRLTEAFVQEALHTAERHAGSTFSQKMTQLFKAQSRTPSAPQLATLCKTVYLVGCKFAHFSSADGAGTPESEPQKRCWDEAFKSSRVSMATILRGCTFACLHHPRSPTIVARNKEDFEDFKQKLEGLLSSKEADLEKIIFLDWIDKFKVMKSVLDKAKQGKSSADSIEDAFKLGDCISTTRMMERKRKYGILEKINCIFDRMRQIAKGYCDDITWLYQVLRQEGQLYGQLLDDLHTLIKDLEALESHECWNHEEKGRLELFIKTVEELKASQESDKDKLDALTKELMEQGYMKDAGLKSLLAKDSKEAERELCELISRAKGKEELPNMKVKAAVAYARAKLDSRGCHMRLSHPSLMVLWHKCSDVLKEVSDWHIFFDCFPAKLVEDRSVIKKIGNAMEPEETFRQRVNEIDGTPKDEQKVNVHKINYVFKKERTLVESVQSQMLGADDDLYSEPEGVRTPQIFPGLPQPVSKRCSKDGNKTSADEEKACARIWEGGQGSVVGRQQDVERALEYLEQLDRQKDKKGILLWGPAGVGKSTLAATLAEKMQQQKQATSPLGDFVSTKCDMFGETTWKGVLGNICARIGMSNGKEHDPDLAAEELAQYLRKTASKMGSQKKRHLLWLDTCEEVLENVELAGKLGSFLNKLCARESGLRLLLTSRVVPAEQLRKLHNRVEVREVKPLEIDCAKEILLQGDRGGVDMELVTAVAQDLQCIPLRLSIAAGILKAGAADIKELHNDLEEWKQENADAPFQVESAVSTPEQKLLLKYWLRDSDKEKPRKQLLRLSMFASSFSTSQAEFMLEGVTESAPCTLQRMYRQRLLQPSNGRGDEGQWIIHAEVRRSVQAEQDEEHRQDASTKFAICMAEEVVDFVLCYKNNPKIAMDALHTQHANIQAAFASVQGSLSMQAEVANRILHSWVYLSTTVGWVEAFGVIATALLPILSLMHQAVQAHIGTMNATNTNGSSSSGSGGGSGSGKDEAGIDGDSLNAWAQDCHVIEERGKLVLQLPEGNSKYLQAMEASLKTVMADINNSNGNYNEALSLYGEVLKYYKKQDPGHHDFYTALGNKGSCLISLGKFFEALPRLQKAHKAIVQLDSCHPSARAFTMKLAECLKELGKYDDALLLYEAEEKRSEEGLNFPSLTTTFELYNKKAACLKSMGNYDDALMLFQKAYDGRTHELGPVHPKTYESMNNLATCLARAGKYDQAKDYFQKGLRDTQETLEPLHPTRLMLMDNFAGCLNMMGKYKEARRYYQDAWEGRLEKLGPDHPDTAHSAKKWADRLRSFNKCDDALRLYNEVLDKIEKIYGSSHPYYFSTMVGLADCYKRMGQKDEALNLYQRALEGTKKALGPKHPHTYANIDSMASCLQAMGRYEEARQEFQKAYEGTRSVLGFEHAHTHACASHLADCLCSLGLYNDARPLYEAAYEGSMLARGCDHNLTKKCKKSLAKCQGNGSRGNARCATEQIGVPGRNQGREGNPE